MVLLMVTVVLLVFGAVLSAFYGIQIIETMALSIAKNPMALLNLAGAIALIMVVFKIAQLAAKHAKANYLPLRPIVIGVETVASNPPS